MGTDKDENILNDQELTSDSLASARASKLFDSAADGDLNTLQKLIATAFSSEIRLEIDEANLSSSLLAFLPCLNLLRDKKNSTPLHYAAGNGHVEVCRFLLQTVAKEPRNNATICSGETTASSYANTPNKTQGRTALHWAARNGHLEVCKLLVEDYGANPDPLAKGDVTPLQLAVWRGHLDVCLWLSEKGCADKHFMNGWGCTVHHWLAKSPIYAEALQQTNSQNKEQTHSHRDRDDIDATKHAERKLLALCKWLDDEPQDSSSSTSSKRSPWNRPNDHGQTPLHKAGFGGNMPVLKFLIETKRFCDICRDSQHNTAADCAERNRQWEAAKYLRRHGNPKCLQNASTVLFPKCNEPPRIPSLASIRAAYIELARLYHPDRSIESRSNNQDATIHNSPTTMSRWKDLQDAYRLWTLWWRDPDEADSLIRGLERHFYLQRQLPLLLLWHEQWHDTRESNENTELGGQKIVSRNAKKQKVDSHNENFGHRPPSKRQFSDEALQRLEDFERKLVRLLSTLPSQEIPLSQLPKEYEKTWGGTNSDGQTAMIRPRTYRCKKLRFLLEKHCSRTIEVVPRFREEGETAVTILMVRLCNVK